MHYETENQKFRAFHSVTHLYCGLYHCRTDCAGFVAVADYPLGLCGQRVEGFPFLFTRTRPAELCNRGHFPGVGGAVGGALFLVTGEPLEPSSQNQYGCLAVV